MKKHFNLYYLFLEDKLLSPISIEKSLKIRKKVEEFYKMIKPP